MPAHTTLDLVLNSISNLVGDTHIQELTANFVGFNIRFYILYSAVKPVAVGFYLIPCIVKIFITGNGKRAITFQEDNQ